MAPVAVLFGAERTGLTNEELDTAHLLIRIPGNPEYLSLNVAMAAQIVAYEIFRAARHRRRASAAGTPVPLATPEQMERLYEHLRR